MILHYVVPMQMLMTQRARANGKHAIGPGGSRCACCAEAPKNNRRVRRAVKRAERQDWKREVA